VDKRHEFRSTKIDRPDFVPFDENRAVRIYRRNLPHWRQHDATYFVTFRLGDSIPKAKLREWDYEKQKWLAARGLVGAGRKSDWRHALKDLSDGDQYQFQKQFNRLFHTELDESRGDCHLIRAACLRELRDKLFDSDGESYHLGDFIIMPNHVHLLLIPKAGHELEMILKSLKGSTARLCNLAIKRTGSFWQADSYDHIVRDLEQLLQFRQYIADNPNKAGISVAAEALYRASWMDRWFLS
jgi:REP element-mobilizing transposase RayT